VAWPACSALHEHLVAQELEAKARVISDVLGAVRVEERAKQEAQHELRALRPRLAAAEAELAAARAGAAQLADAARSAEDTRDEARVSHEWECQAHERNDLGTAF
jgi:hypothetical protein